MKIKEKEPFLKGKPYLLSFFVAYSSLVLISCIMNMFGLMYPLDAQMLLGLALSVGISCFLMSLTDKLPLTNDFMIGLMDILCIVVTVFGLNLISAFTNDAWFDFNIGMIIVILATIVLTYTSTCIIFFLTNLKSERDINAKIKIMKKPGKINEGNEDNNGK